MRFGNLYNSSEKPQLHLCVCLCTRVQWHVSISSEETVAKMVDQANGLNIY